MRVKTIKTSFTAGELDPRLWFREDLKYYFNGAALLKNVLAVPQGGLRQRPGTVFFARKRKVLEGISFSGATITAPNGGTAANAIDGNPATKLTTTTSMGTTSPYVILHVDFGAATEVGLVDVVNIKLSTGALTDEFRWQWSSDNSTWTDFDGTFSLASSVRTRRRAMPAGSTRAARYWRLARIGATSLAATVELEDVSFWKEGETISKDMQIEFAFSTEQEYALCATDRNIEVFRNFERVASIPVPHTSDMLNILKWTQSLDTLILFHPDYAPWKVFRQGGHDEWDNRACTFTNIPTFDFGSGLEPVMSDTRGWPRCGTFYQSRLFMGGLKGRPQTILASRASQFFDLDASKTEDDYGFMVTADTDQVSAVYQIYAGRHLQIFTSGAEFFIPSEPIAPLGMALKMTTRSGMGGTEGAPEGVRVHGLAGATLFVQRGGKSLREFLYNDLSQGYDAESISLLASHLINAPVRSALRRSTSTTDCDYLFLVLESGSISCLTAIRTQEVTAWVRHETNGKFIGVGALPSGDVWFSVERTIGGETVHYLEKWQDDVYLDCAVSEDAPEGGLTALSGLDHLEGETVRLWVDGAPAGSVIVSEGAVQLGQTAHTTAQAGLAFDTITRTLPPRVQMPDGTSMGRVARIIGADIALVEASGVFVSANGMTPFPVALPKLGAGALDAPEKAIFTGTARAQGFAGFGTETFLEISKSDPGPFGLDAISLTVEVHGY